MSINVEHAQWFKRSPLKVDESVQERTNDSLNFRQLSLLFDPGLTKMLFLVQSPRASTTSYLPGGESLHEEHKRRYPECNSQEHQHGRQGLDAFFVPQLVTQEKSAFIPNIKTESDYTLNLFDLNLLVLSRVTSFSQLLKEAFPCRHDKVICLYRI